MLICDERIVQECHALVDTLGLVLGVVVTPADTRVDSNKRRMGGGTGWRQKKACFPENAFWTQSIPER